MNVKHVSINADNMMSGVITSTSWGTFTGKNRGKIISFCAYVTLN